MPRRVTDEGQRRLPVSFTLRHIVREMIETEAQRRGMLFGPTMEALALEALAMHGYPTDEAEPADTTSELREQFLTHYASVGNVTEACRRTGIALNTFYRWLMDDKDYARRYNEMKARKPGTGGAHRSELDAWTERSQRQQRRGGRPIAREVGPDGRIIGDENL